MSPTHAQGAEEPATQLGNSPCFGVPDVGGIGAGLDMAAVANYKSLGITVLRVMTDNGSCYRSRAFARACRASSSSTSAQSLIPSNQRQGRALHPDIATRMGLWPSLCELQTAGPALALLHAPLQLAPTPCQYRPGATDHQTRPEQGQPVETPQLGQQHMADADRMIGPAAETDVTKRCQHGRDCPQAAALPCRGLRRQASRFCQHFIRNRLTPFTPALFGALPIARVAQLGHKPRLLELRNRAEDLPHQLGSGTDQ
jgi:transposase InsO family protein